MDVFWYICPVLSMITALKVAELTSSETGHSMSPQHKFKPQFKLSDKMSNHMWPQQAQKWLHLKNYEDFYEE